jgi:hypothetical protein
VFVPMLYIYEYGVQVVGFPNIRHAMKTIRQNYSGFYSIPLDKSRVGKGFIT